MTAGSRRLGLTAALLLLLALALLAVASRAGPLPLDRRIYDALGHLFPGILIGLIDRLAGLPVVAAVGLGAAAYLWVQRRRTTAGIVVLGLAVEAATPAVKLLVNRPRPPDAGPINDLITNASFPSGHTVRVMVLVGLLIAAFAWDRREARVRALTIGAAIVAIVGVARIASGEHWPSDVLGGLLLGGAWLSGCLFVARAAGVSLPDSESTPRRSRNQARRMAGQPSRSGDSPGWRDR